MFQAQRFAPVILTGALVFGATFARADGIGPLTAEALKNRSQLQILFRDVEDQPQRCPLHVRRMEYLGALQTLVVDLTAEACAMDVTGKREGKLHWDLPLALRSKGALKLLVQGKNLGRVQWEGQQARWLSEESSKEGAER